MLLGVVGPPIVEYGILKQIEESADEKRQRHQIVLPISKMKEILREIHGDVFGGHFGAKKMLEKL